MVEGRPHVLPLPPPHRDVTALAPALGALVQEQDGVASLVEPAGRLQEALEAVPQAVNDDHRRAVGVPDGRPGADAQPLGEHEGLLVPRGRGGDRPAVPLQEDVGEGQRDRHQDHERIEEEAAQHRMAAEGPPGSTHECGTMA